MDRETLKKSLPNLTEKQLDIIEFWSVRGYGEITHCLGMDISLHKEPRFQCLGLDLIYLEQFLEEFAESKRQSGGEKQGVTATEARNSSQP